MNKDELQECVNNDIPVYLLHQLTYHKQISNYATLKSAYDACFISFYYKDNIGNQEKFFNCDDELETLSLLDIKKDHPDLFACYDLFRVLRVLFNGELFISSHINKFMHHSNDESYITIQARSNKGVYPEKNYAIFEVKLSDINLKYINKLKLMYASKRLYIIESKINNKTIASEIISMNVGLEIDVEYGYEIPHK